MKFTFVVKLVVLIIIFARPCRGLPGVVHDVNRDDCNPFLCSSQAQDCTPDPDSGRPRFKDSACTCQVCNLNFYSTFKRHCLDSVLKLCSSDRKLLPNQVDDKDTTTHGFTILKSSVFRISPIVRDQYGGGGGKGVPAQECRSLMCQQMSYPPCLPDPITNTPRYLASSCICESCPKPIGADSTKDASGRYMHRLSCLANVLKVCPPATPSMISTDTPAIKVSPMISTDTPAIRVSVDSPILPSNDGNGITSSVVIPNSDDRIRENTTEVTTAGNPGENTLGIILAAVLTPIVIIVSSIILIVILIYKRPTCGTSDHSSIIDKQEFLGQRSSGQKKLMNEPVVCSVETDKFL